MSRSRGAALDGTARGAPSRRAFTALRSLRHVGAPLTAAFYNRGAEEVARDLLGAVLECTVRGVRCRGRVVETEAYVGEHDAACHAAAGRTARTEGLFGPPGTAYVYLIYGMYWCANAVTGPEGTAGAVLLRGAEPLEGQHAMRRRRDGVQRDGELANGPGKLCAAFGITGPRHHGVFLGRGSLRILAGDPVPDDDVAVTPRIGINPSNPAVDWPLRWIVRSSPCVSAPRATLRFLGSGQAIAPPQITSSSGSRSRGCSAVPGSRCS